MPIRFLDEQPGSVDSGAGTADQSRRPRIRFLDDAPGTIPAPAPVPRVAPDIAQEPAVAPAAPAPRATLPPSPAPTPAQQPNALEQAFPGLGDMEREHAAKPRRSVPRPMDVVESVGKRSAGVIGMLGKASGAAQRSIGRATGAGWLEKSGDDSVKFWKQRLGELEETFPNEYGEALKRGEIGTGVVDAVRVGQYRAHQAQKAALDFVDRPEKAQEWIDNASRAEQQMAAISEAAGGPVERTIKGAAGSLAPMAESMALSPLPGAVPAYWGAEGTGSMLTDMVAAEGVPVKDIPEDRRKQMLRNASIGGAVYAAIELVQSPVPVLKGMGADPAKAITKRVLRTRLLSRLKDNAWVEGVARNGIRWALATLSETAEEVGQGAVQAVTPLTVDQEATIDGALSSAWQGMKEGAMSLPEVGVITALGLGVSAPIEGKQKRSRLESIREYRQARDQFRAAEATARAETPVRAMPRRMPQEPTLGDFGINIARERAIDIGAAIERERAAATPAPLPPAATPAEALTPEKQADVIEKIAEAGSSAVVAPPEPAPTPTPLPDTAPAPDAPWLTPAPASDAGPLPGAGARTQEPPAVSPAAGGSTSSDEATSEDAQPSPFMQERAQRIKESKAAGNVHLDAEPLAVENARGRTIYNVHDPKERGTIRTVSNRGDVVVHWDDEYSSVKNLATRKEEKRGGKSAIVYESWLMPTDLQDYVFGDGKKDTATPPTTPAKISRLRPRSPTAKAPTQSQPNTQPGGAAPASPVAANVTETLTPERVAELLGLGEDDKKPVVNVAGKKTTVTLARMGRAKWERIKARAEAAGFEEGFSAEYGDDTVQPGLVLKQSAPSRAELEQNAPELMTPSAYANSEAERSAAAGNDYQIAKNNAASKQRMAMDRAVAEKRPLLAETWDKFRKRPPPGYVRSGDRYVYKPQGETATEEDRAAGNTAELDSKHRLKKPIKGKTGAELVGYQWVSTVEDGMYGDRRVSDWSGAQTSVPTGRQIVHLFWVRTPDGQETLMGVGAAKKALGFHEQRLYSVAKQEQDAQAYRAKQDAEELKSIESIAVDSTAEAARLHRENTYSPMRSEAENERLFRDSVLLTKNGKFLRAGPARQAIMEANGWEVVADDPMKRAIASASPAGEAATETPTDTPAAPAPATKTKATTKRAKRGLTPAATGARTATAEGAAAVASAQALLRDAINNPDLVGPQRADTIANLKALVAFLEANADTRKPIETDIFNGDQIAYTGVVNDDGFREFIYLEGAKAGAYGVRMTAEERAAMEKRKSDEEAARREDFRKLEKGKRAKRGLTPPPAPSTPTTAPVAKSTPTADGQTVTSPAGEAEARRNDGELSGAKQKKYLLAEIATAIKSAPDNAIEVPATPEQERARAAQNERDSAEAKWDEVWSKERPAEPRWGAPAEEKAEFESAKNRIRDEPLVAELTPLLDEFDIPETKAEEPGYVSVAGDRQGYVPARQYTADERVNMLADKLRDAAAPKYGTVTIEVPGDGTFEIINSVESLKAFAEAAKKFPTTPAQPTFRPRSVPRPVTIAAESNRPEGVKSDKWVKLLQPFASTDENRKVLMAPYHAGKAGEMVATDGRRMAVAFGIKGSQDKVDGKFPNYAQVVPNYRAGKLPSLDGLKTVTITDTEKLSRQLVQAASVYEKGAVAIAEFFRMPDGSLAVASRTENNLNTYQSDDVLRGEYMVTLDPSFVADAIDFLRRTGNKTVTMAYVDNMAPAVFIGEKEYVVQMPMRSEASPELIAEAQRGAYGTGKQKQEVVASASFNIGDRVQWTVAGKDYTGTVIGLGAVSKLPEIRPDDDPENEIMVPPNLRKIERKVTEPAQEPAPAPVAEQEPETAEQRVRRIIDRDNAIAEGLGKKTRSYDETVSGLVDAGMSEGEAKKWLSDLYGESEPAPTPPTPAPVSPVVAALDKAVEALKEVKNAVQGGGSAKVTPPSPAPATAPTVTPPAAAQTVDSAKRRKVANLVNGYTAGKLTQFDWILAGSVKAASRAHIMSEIAGQRVPQSKSGITALRDALYKMFDVTGEHDDARAQDFSAKVKAALAEEPVAQPLPPSVTLESERELNEKPPTHKTWAEFDAWLAQKPDAEILNVLYEQAQGLQRVKDAVLAFGKTGMNERADRWTRISVGSVYREAIRRGLKVPRIPELERYSGVSPKESERMALPTPAAPREPWGMTKEEIIAEDHYGNRTDKGNWTDARKAESYKSHIQEIQIALRAGKPVPARVLADYPELARGVGGVAEEDASPSPAPAQESPSIESGAELTYNRRNRVTRRNWSDFEPLNPALKAREVQKGNVWPAPDYQAMIDGGQDVIPTDVKDARVVLAHVAKQVRDAVASKPNVRGTPTDEDFKRYVDGVQRVESGLKAWMASEDGAREWLAGQGRRAGVMAGAMRGTPTAISAFAYKGPQKTLLDFVYPDGWKAHRDEVIVLGGNRLLQRLQPGMDELKRAMKDKDAGWPTKREAWQVQGWRVLNTAIEKPQAIALTRYDENRNEIKTYRVQIGEGRRGVVLPERYATRQEAEAALSSVQPFIVANKADRPQGAFATEAEAIEAAREATKRDGSGQKDIEGTNVAQAERIGAERRLDGQDVDAEKLREVIGFRGVNFGNWMQGPSDRTEAQAHLNHAHDAMLDLAEILNVPPKAMSLDGLLGLAIGAQGSGKHAAHFVPGLNEINITRTRGSGALSHEWAHGMDHYFGRMAGFEANEAPYITEHIKLVGVDGYIKRDGKKVPFDGVRPEVAGAFKTIVDAMRRKPMTAEYSAKLAADRLGESSKAVNGWLNAIRRDDFSGQEAEFDRLADRVRAGDFGEGRIAVGTNFKRGNVPTAIFPVVDEMRQLYKAKHGRMPAIDNYKALQSWLDSVAYQRSHQDASATHVPQTMKTDYLTEAEGLQKDKKGKRYWDTPREMFARAFDAYVADTLQERAAKNSYLAGLEIAAPKGEERKAINAAFDVLVKELKTRPTERGVAMYGDIRTGGYNEEDVVEYATSAARGYEIPRASREEWGRDFDRAKRRADAGASGPSRLQTGGVDETFAGTETFRIVHSIGARLGLNIIPLSPGPYKGGFSSGRDIVGVSNTDRAIPFALHEITHNFARNNDADVRALVGMVDKKSIMFGLVWDSEMADENASASYTESAANILGITLEEANRPENDERVYAVIEDLLAEECTAALVGGANEYIDIYRDANAARAMLAKITVRIMAGDRPRGERNEAETTGVPSRRAPVRSAIPSPLGRARAVEEPQGQGTSRTASDGGRQDSVRASEATRAGAIARSRTPRAVTPAMDREYMAAVERGDEAAAQRMVDEAAKAAGYNVGPVYHGSNILFNEFSVTSDIGFHFGSERAAIERRTRLGAVDEIDIEDLSPSAIDSDSLRVSRGEIGGDPRSDLYALLLRKLDYPKPDLRAQIDSMPSEDVDAVTSEYRSRPDSKRFVGRVEKARTGRAYRVGGTGVLRTVSTIRDARAERALQRKRLSTPTKAFLRAIRTLEMRDLGVWPSSEIASESGIPLNQFRDTRDYESVRETLIRNGYDAIQYENLVEDAGSTSYIVFSPSQIKSADPITRDDAGRVIPLSERFNDATGDIRFGQINRRDSDAGPDAEVERQVPGASDASGRDASTRQDAERQAAGLGARSDVTAAPRRRATPRPMPPSPDRAAATIPAAVADAATSTPAWDTIASFQDFIDAVETSMRAYDQERVDNAIRVTQAVERDASKKIVEQTRSIMRDKVKAERDAGKTKAIGAANASLAKKFAGARLPPPRPVRSIPQAVNEAFVGGKAVMRGVILDTSIDSAVERSFWEALKRTRSSPNPGDKWRAQLSGMMAMLKAVDAETRGRTPEQVKDIVSKRIAGLFGEERRHMMSAAARANPVAMLAAIRKYATQHVADYYAGPLAKMIARYSPPRILAQFTDAPKAKLTALLGRLPAIPANMKAAEGERAILRRLATNLDAKGNVTPDSDLTALIDAHDAFAEAVAEDKRMREYLKQAWRGKRASMAEHAADDIVGGGLPPISGTEGVDPRSRGWWKSFLADDTYTYANVIYALSGGRKDSWLYKHFVEQPRRAVERATARKNAAMDALTTVMRDEKLDMLEMGGRLKPYEMPDGQKLHLTDFQRIGLWNGLGGLVDNSALATYDPDWAASYMNGAALLSRYSATTGTRIQPQDQMEAMDILTTIFKDMPESHKKLGRAMKDSMQSNTADANDASRRLFGRSLFIIPNYWTIARRYTATPGDVSSGTFLRTLLDSIGLTKDRTDNTLPLVIDDAWQTFSRHAQQLSLFTEFAEQQHNLMAVLADENVRRAMSERFGTQIEKDVTDTLLEVSGLARGAEESTSTVDRAVTNVLGNVVTSMLWGSGSVYAKNRLLGGWTLALQLMKERPSLGLGLLARMTLPKSITMGEQTRAIRQALLDHGYFGDRWGLRAEEVFSQVYHRDAVLRPTATPMPLRKTFRAKRAVDQWGIRPQARAEMRTAIMAIQAMVNDGMSMSDAVDATAEAFREVQNPSTPFEHTREYRSILRNTWKKIIYPFTGQLFVTANIVRQDMIALAGAKARGEPTAALRGRAAIGLAQMILNIAGSYGIGMVFASMLRGRIPFTGDDDDKERDAAWAVMQQASDLLDIIRPGLGRMVIGVAETTFSKRVTPREDSIIGRQGATLVQGIRQVVINPARAEAAGRPVNEDRVLDGWRKLAEGVSALSLPPIYGASRIARQAAGAYKIASGEVEPTPPVDDAAPRRYSRTDNRAPRAVPRRYVRQQ